MRYAILIALLAVGCSSSLNLPSQRLSQVSVGFDYIHTDGTLRLILPNRLHCPLRVKATSGQAALNTLLQQYLPSILPPLTDTVIAIPWSDTGATVRYGILFGDPGVAVDASRFDLPFQRGKEYKFIQGYDSNPSHNTSYSRYALDFGLAIGDTVCAAADGYVIGVVEGYSDGGNDRAWRPYANFITLYHPDNGLYTQYAHLVHRGSMVEVGDRVAAGQPIGLSGMTGYTTISHVHFNVLRPVDSDEGMVSTPIDSIGPYAIPTLERGQMLRH